MKKIIIIIIFITGLHKKPQGCGAPVASAAGLFNTKRTEFLSYCEAFPCVHLIRNQENIVQL
jgi:hypothetical protein